MLFRIIIIRIEKVLNANGLHHCCSYSVVLEYFFFYIKIFVECLFWQVDLFRTITFRNSGQTYKGIPIIASNMDTIGTFAMAKVLAKVISHFIFRFFIGWATHILSCFSAQMSFCFPDAAWSVHCHPQVHDGGRVEGIF